MLAPRFRTLPAAFLIVLALASRASADTIYGNNGSLPGFTGVYAVFPISPYWMQFTAVTSGRAGWINFLARAESPATTANVRVSLWTAAGDLPAAQLGYWQLNIPTGFPITRSVMIAPNHGPLLTAGTTYFLGLRALDHEVTWWANNPLATGVVDSLYGDGTMYSFHGQLAAFSIVGRPREELPTPEPASMWLLASGVAMGVRRWRHARTA